jgi:hypothetical protein
MVGTRGPDVLVGTRHNDVIVGLGGDDIIRAGAGQDKVCDNGGNDHVILGAGDDEAGGGDGNDRIEGGRGDDWLAGRAGRDTIKGGRGDDRIIGELGNDNLSGEAGADNIGGGPGTDRCDGGPGHDRIRTCERGPIEDRPPVAVDDTDSTSEVGVKLVSVLANDSDPDGDALHVASVDATGTIGGVAVAPGGSGIRYDPTGHFDTLAPGESATDQFSYRLAGGTAAARVVVTIAGTDTDPHAVADTRSGIDEDDPAQVIDVLANETDPDGGTPATIASVTQPPNGTVAITGGGTALTYQPSQDYCTNTFLPTDNFSYSLAPGGSTAPVSVTVTCENDAPEMLTSGGQAAFVEDAGPAQVDGGLDVIDVDSSNLSSATVAITGNFQSEDSLGVTAEPGITPSYNSGTGVLTLTGEASVTDYVLTLKSITYSNDSDTPNTADRTVSFTVTDSSSAPSTTATRDVSVTPANDAPVVGTSGGNTSYTENAAATVIDASATVADPDDTNIESATVRVSSGFQSGDALTIAAQAGITDSYDSGTGVLTLTGSKPLADYQTALQAVKFSSTHDNPPATKAVEFKLNDGDANSNAPTKTIAIAAVNDAPTLTTTGAALGYGEDAGAVAVDTGLTITDPDSTQIQGATVTISSGFVSAEDELAFAAQSGITGSYNDTTGTMTLSATAGTASVSAFQAALRSVTYNNSSNSPTTPRTVTFQATDAEGDASNSPTRTINISAANDSTVVTTSPGSTGYTEGAAAVVVDSALTVSDPDDTNLEGATVTISGGANTGDTLQYVDQPGIAGSGSGTGTLTLTGSATLAAYQAALRTVKFVTTHDNPTVTKTIEFKANDGDGLGNGASKTITVTRVNDGPTINTTSEALSYEEGDGATAADSGLTLTDPDSTGIDGATVQITANHVQSEDTLAFADTADIAGTYDDATGKLTLTGFDTVENYETALKSVTYENGSSTPTVSTRTVSFQATDAEGDNSNTATRDISVGPVNDAPTVTTSGDDTDYAEGDPATQIDGGVTVADVDDTNIESAEVKISAGFDAGDLLELVDQAGITDSYDAGAGILTLTGSKSLADYQTALRAITFRSTSDDPAASKTVAFKVSDGDLDSAAATKTITVTPSNDGPTITTTATNLDYTENEGAKVIDSALTLTEDSTEVASAQVWINTPEFDSTQDSLAFTDQLGITGIYHSATGVLDLTGTTTPANYQTALRSVTYSNSSEGPSPARTISFQATDGLATAGNIATRGIAITAENDPPTAVDDTGTTDEDTTLSVAAAGVLGNDTDPDSGDTKTVTELNGSATLTGTSDDGAAVTINADGSYTYNPGNLYQGLSTGETDTDFFTYTMADGAGSPDTATVNITIDGVSDAPTATADSFNAIGNTALYVGSTKPAGTAGKEISGSVLANDTDPDSSPGSLNVEPVTDAPTTQGGTVTIASNGHFVYQPDDGDTGVGDTFTYRVCDTGPPCDNTTVTNSTGTVTLPLAGQVWYVKNDSAAGGDGTSDGPFDTLAEAETASGANDTTFVYDGDDGTTGLDSGYAMDSGERLLGEVHGLSVDPDQGGPLGTESLRGAVANAHPTLTANNEDVVALDDGNELRGFVLDPQGTGGGIAGGSGDTGGGTIDNVKVTDTGTAGDQPGLKLESTAGTFNISELTVDNSGATSPPSTAKGVYVHGAGTTNFLSAGTISITTKGAAGLDADTTNMGSGSVFDDITVTASGSGGVRLFNTTGTTQLGGGSGADLSLTTTSGGTAALSISSGGTVSVPSAGTSNISASGGPAIDVNGTPGISLDLDTVSSTGSATSGISLSGLAAGTFTAAAGSISGATGTAFSVSGGSGAITYPGNLGDGTGQAASILSRTGGAVTLSGQINDSSDAGGGITVSSNTGGSTTFSSGTKTIRTTNGVNPNAVVMSASDGHTLRLTGGGLDIDTTTGRGLHADTSGTIEVSGSGNTIDSTTGRALEIANTDIAATGGATPGGVTFQRISSNGAPTGITLNNTGAAGSGPFTVAGNGGSCTGAASCSGGAIQSSTANGMTLTGVGGGVSLHLMQISQSTAGVGGGDDGINGSNIAGFALDDSRVINHGNTGTDDGVDLSQVSGTVGFNGTTVDGSAHNNVVIANTSGNATITVAGGNYSNTNNFATSGADAILLRNDQTGTMTATIGNATFNNNRDDHVQATADGDSAATINLTVTGNTMTDPVGGQGNGITVNPGGTSTTELTVTGNNIQGSNQAAITVDGPGSAPLPQPSNIDATITGNTIGNAAVSRSGSWSGVGVAINSNGGADIDALVSSNNIFQYTNPEGLTLIQNDGVGSLNATVRGNIIGSQADTPNNIYGVRAIYGSDVTDTGTGCLDLGGAGAFSNNLTGSSPTGSFDIRLRQAGPTTLQLPGYGGTSHDTAAVGTYLVGRNTAPHGADVSQPNASATYTGAANCPLP